MRPLDQLLDDEQLVELVYEALVRRHPKSRTRGRLGTPAEVVLRMLVLKHLHNWSFGVLEWEVRANLVYRQFTRVMKRVTELAGRAGTKFRDRSRSVKLRAVEIARVSRSKSIQGQQRMKDLYGKLLDASGRVARQAEQFANEIASGVKRSADVIQQAALEGMKKELEIMVGRVKQVRRQARERVFAGNTHVEGKLVSMFEHTTEIIRRGKAKQPTEFGKMIKV